MQIRTQAFVKFLNGTLGLLLATLSLAGFCFSQTVSLSPQIGPPTTKTLASGSGFPANSAVDVYFDTTDVALAATDGAGAFSKILIQAPSSAVPGGHYVTGVARSNGTAGQTTFLVRTNWAGFGFSPNNKRQNPYEHVLSPATVGGLGLAWTLPRAKRSLLRPLSLAETSTLAPKMEIFTP